MVIELNNLQAHLRRHPTRVVTLSLGGRPGSRTFEELAADVDVAVARLRAAGLGAGMRVGILAENSWAWMVHDLAISACDAVSVAFPADFAEGPLDELLEREELALLLVSEQLLRGRSDASRAVMVLDRDAPEVGAARAVEPRRYPLVAGDHSYVYSSGTSNNRKGMIVTRDGTVELLEAFAEAYGFGDTDSILIFMPFAGYQQRLLYYAAAAFGMDLHLTEPTYLFQALSRFQPTILIGPPALYSSIANLAERAAKGDPRRILGGRSRVLITGMARIKRETLDYFKRHDLPLHEVYGLTECGVVAINRPGCEELGSVGRPLRGVTLTIAEDGEIIVDKRCPLTRGYFEKPVAPHDTRIESRRTFTGDIGHIDEGGFLHVRGRKAATIISSSGEKVQSEPLEEQLEECSVINRAVVFGGGSLPYLVAVFECVPGHSAQDDAPIRDFLARLNPRLPEWARIHRWAISDVEFTRENGLMTQTMRLNRRLIRQRFARQLDLPDEGIA
ncbi:AMP-binding protein [Sorangium sp. So ce1151]|uniref:AMP-binding protein n=1 Tax=Sorangium sp. So ce1151 TaxID=3133332 RepID=UPI003F60E61D